MKLITPELGRLAIIHPLEEIRPRGGVPVHDLIMGIKEKYSFLRGPDLSQPLETLNRDGFLFESGAFVHHGKAISVRDFAIHNDGFIISCYETDYAEEFFEALIRWCKEQFRFKDFSIEPKRYYRSIILVEFDKSLNHIATAFSELSNLFQKTNEKYTGRNNPINLVRIGFGMDETKVSGIITAPFTLERKIAFPHESERYFSEAPIPTAAHIELLQAIEDILP